MTAYTEEEQLEQLKSFFKKYGSSIVTGILVAVLGFSGWQYWNNKKTAENQLLTAKVQQLMDDAAQAKDNPALQKSLAAAADAIIKQAPNSVHAVQSELLLAKLAFDQSNYAAAEKALSRVAQSDVDDAGLMNIIHLRLSYAQLAQQKYAAALQSLDKVNDPAFAATAFEARGDVFVAQNQLPKAREAYLKAWDELLKRKQQGQILQMKLQSVGVLVDDPKFDGPIIETAPVAQAPTTAEATLNPSDTATETASQIADNNS